MSSTQFEATVLAGDLGLLEERIVLKRTLTRGQLILFSTLSALLRPRALHQQTPPTLAAQPGARSSRLLRTDVRSRSRRVQYLLWGPPLRGWNGGTVATKHVLIPLLSVAEDRKTKRRGKGNRGGGDDGRSDPLFPPSNRALSSVSRFNGIMQEDQLQFQPVLVSPTCETCTAARRDLNDDHRNCAFFSCSRYKRIDHPSLACPF